jgi:hypothetical protein
LPVLCQNAGSSGFHSSIHDFDALVMRELQ